MERMESKLSNSRAKVKVRRVNYRYNGITTKAKKVVKSV